MLLFILFLLLNPETDSECLARSNALLDKTILLDGHVDLPYRLHEGNEDISVRTQTGHFDYPRAIEGHLSAPFMSIYVPARLEKEGAFELANSLINRIEQLTRDHADKFALAYSPEDLQKNFQKGLISLPMGMENGAPIEGKLENLDYFYQRGIRYITLAHSKDNHICDSSYDTTHTWKGLSPFGEMVVKRMNQLGIMVDVSHITDDTFYQVMQISKAPVIASHSSCRHFVPGFERNMSDKMIQLLAEKGGVIQITFGSFFLTEEANKAGSQRWKAVHEFMEQNELKGSDPKVEAFRTKYATENPVKETKIDDVVAHIDHVVQLVGIDHVGVGSDYDGVGGLPIGMEDVRSYPRLMAALLCKGYSEVDIQKICSGNVMRVWRNVEKVAKNLEKLNSR